MTPEQRKRLEALAVAARCINDDDWGSPRQIEAANDFHIFVSDDLGIDTEDMQTAKASSDEMIDEALRRAEEKHLCDEYQAWLTSQGLRQLSADELIYEDITSEQRKYISDFINRWNEWEEWKSWSPRPAHTIPHANDR